MIKKPILKQKEYKKKYKKSSKFLFYIRRNKKLYTNKHTTLNFKYFLLKTSLNFFNLKISIRVRSNNIFCTLINLKTNKVIFNVSSGKYQINTSKKKLKFNTKLIINSFLNDIDSYLKQNQHFIVELIAPLKTRKQSIKLLIPRISRKNLILSVKENKCFNGCRPPKKKRKKNLRVRFRIFK